MFCMVTRDRPDSIGTQKLALIEHAGKDSAQPVRTDQPGNTAPGDTKMSRPRRVNAVKEPRHSPQTLRKERQKMRNPLPLPRLEHRRCTNGQQTNHGADLKPRGSSIREPEYVVVKPILVAPQAGRPHPVHGLSDQKAMVGKLRC